MTDNAQPTQGSTLAVLQPMSEVFISPRAQWYTSLRMEAQPGTPPAGVPPADGGQGPNGDAGTGGNGGGGFNWEMFPGVPEEHRPLLEPHMRGIQGHVTKLEQQYAPYKPVIDAGLSGDDLQGLVNLNKAFSENPVEAFLKLGADLQAAKAISDDLDFDAVRQVLEGKTEPEVPAAPGVEGEQIPQWAKELQDRQKAQEDRETQTTQQQQVQRQEQLLNETTSNMKAQLKEAGFTDDQLNDPGMDNLLTSAILTAKGDPDAAMKSIMGFRDSVLKGLNGNQPKPGDGDDLSLPNGAPPVPKQPGRGARREFAEANAGARQFLERKNATAAQE